MKTETHFNIAKGVVTTAPSMANETTKANYWFLVGEINRGTMQKAVCRIENKTFGTESYYVISL